MEWIERLNDAIGYIEEHLTDEMDYEQLGQIACCSSYHFQRMFTYMAGIVPLIIFRECSRIWQGFPCLNISAGEKCHLPL